MIKFYIIIVVTVSSSIYIIYPQSNTLGYKNNSLIIRLNKQELLTSIYNTKDDTVNLSIPYTSAPVENQNLKIIDKDTQELLLQYFSSQFSFYSILISVIVVVLGIGIALLQWILARQKSKELEEKFETLSLKNNFEKNIKDLNGEINKKIPREVKEKVDYLFNSKYRQEIFNNTKRFTNEVMMLEPGIRAMTTARFRRFQREDLYTLMKEILGEENSSKLALLLGNLIQDWHVLGQLFSLDKDELLKGLIAFITNPFPEAVYRLNKLKKRYESEPDIFPLVLDALESIENIGF